MKHVTYVFDGLSGTTLIGGILTGTNVLMFLGGLATLMSILNHGIQIHERLKKQNKAATTAKEE
jgi:hypothetical protein